MGGDGLLLALVSRVRSPSFIQISDQRPEKVLPFFHLVCPHRQSDGVYTAGESNELLAVLRSEETQTDISLSRL